MLSRLLLAGLLLPAALPLPAQPAPPARPARDTAYALHSLFRERRSKGLQTAGFGLAGLTGTAFTLVRGAVDASVLFGLASAVPTALGVRQYWRFSEDREGGVVRRYEQGWPLPPDVRRRLRAKHFRAMPP